ncbi:PIG-L deacetylase family protein [Phycicoccus mangrovi]|uniref:PIG-L deacetylase family protein n=1 Tax=Phycicoccus mangrovi TaxID=2840470 RepID=UPI001D0163DE|nr:PIG-L deacetylase family protein [Phycicoccus mangrovi]
MVVVAHPDDETFGCGSVLLEAAEHAETVVVCLSRGEAGEVVDGVEVPADGVGALRETELRRAASVLGVSAVEVVGLGDSGMDGEPPTGSICGVPFDDLVARVREAVERHRPDVVVTLDGSDGHRDHARVRDAVLAATPPDVVVDAHCLPRSLLHRWLVEKSGEDSAQAYAELPDIGCPDEDVTTVVDVRRHLPARQAAIREHRSQASPFDGLSDELTEAFLGHDHLRRLRGGRHGVGPEAGAGDVLPR